MTVPDLPKAVLLAITLLTAASARSAFPVVDQATQTARDETRRQILEAELAAEKNALSVLKKEAENIVADKPEVLKKEALSVHEDTLTVLKKEADQHSKNITLINGELSGIGRPTIVKASRKINLSTAADVNSATDTEAPFWDVYRRPKAEMAEVQELINAANGTVGPD